MIRRYFPLLFLLAFHLFLLTYLRFTAWPEMFSYPYLKNHGFLLYRDMVHPYPPILTLTLAYLYNAFGYKLWVLQWFSWGVILASTVCVWLLAKQTTKSDKSAFIAAAAYVSLQPFLDGNMMWFDIAIVPMVLLGTLFFLRKNFLWSGIFFAMGAFTKQTAGLFYITVLAYLIWHDRSRLLRRPLEKSAISFLFGPLIFGVPLLARLWQENALTGFWSWVVWYPATQWSKFPGYVQMEIPRHDLFILLALLATLVAGFITEPKKTPDSQSGDELDSDMSFSFRGETPHSMCGENVIFQPKLAKNKNALPLGVFLTISFVMIYPRFSFFHFQLALAFWAVLAGTFIVNVKRNFALAFSAVFILAVIRLLYVPAFKVDARTDVRFYTSGDLQLALDLQKEISTQNRVFLLGVPSQIYVMADRLPPKPWLDTYVWYEEISGVQDWVVNGWRKKSPDAIIWQIPDRGPWYKPGVYQPEKIVKFVQENYTREKEIRPGIWVWRRR